MKLSSLSGDVSDDDHDTDEDSSEEDDDTRSRGSRASNKGGTRRSSRKIDRPAKSVKLTPGDSDSVSRKYNKAAFYFVLLKFRGLRYYRSLMFYTI